jgi:acid phosphatase
VSRRRVIRPSLAVPLLAAAALALTGVAVAPQAGADTGHGDGGGHGRGHGAVLGFDHLVVIYEENHSFDNLYGGWGRVGHDRVEGRDQAPASRTVQVAQDGTPYDCLLQVDVNLTSPPLPGRCTDPRPAVGTTAFGNAPFLIDRFITPASTTCPAPGDFSHPNGVLDGTGLPGGCTRDLVHRFYQEQYQLDGGKQDRYVTGSDAVGLAMGQYDTKALPVYQYLHGRGAPNYVVADRFFQAAFGGSFLNHQYLIAAQAPVDTSAGPGGANAGLHSQVDAAGFPTSYPLYTPTGPVADRQLTQACGPDANPRVACGDYAVNTMQPARPPSGSGAVLPLIDDSRYPNIGDRMSAAGVSWAWYSGGWAAADAGHPDPLFQFHHQPFAYFADYAPGTPGRAHLKDETDFLAAARRGTLPAVSFVKPVGAENEHPGYTGVDGGDRHLVDLLKAVTGGPDGRRTLVVVTYDEFGGQWDHVPPPGPGSRTRGAYDAFGPGTRIPALLVSAGFDRSGVDHTVYDTTSIMATIEHAFGLAPVGDRTRDGRVADLRRGVRTGRG